MYFNAQELSKIITISAIGAIISVPIGYLGNYLKTIPLLPLGTGQILAGLRLIMIAITALQKSGIAVITGSVKGLVEAALFSFHGLPVIAMSGLQGMLIDIMLQLFSYESKIGLMLGCGLAAMSNVLFLQFFLALPLSMTIYLLVYILSFISGILLGTYLATKLDQMIKTRISLSSPVLNPRSTKISRY